VKKLLLLALFFSSFSLSGFAITTEQQLFEQKYQLEQQKEQIKELKDELKSTKKDIEISTKEEINKINGSVDRFTSVVAILGIGLPIILFLIGWFSAKNTAKKETEEFLNEWVKIKANSDFKKLAEEKLNKKLIEFESGADNKLDNKLKNFETKANSQLKEFETKYEAELNVIRQQVKTTDERQEAERFFNKAYRLGQENKLEEAIKVYDELIAKYKDSKLDDVQEYIALSMRNKGVTLGQLNRIEESLNENDMLIDKYKDSKVDGVQEQVAEAMANKAWAFGQLGRIEANIKACDEMIVKYQDSKNENMQEKVARAMLNKGWALGAFDKQKEGIEVFEELIDKYKDSELDGVQEFVAQAKVNKYELIIIQNKAFSKEEKEWIGSALKLEDKASFNLLSIIENAKSSSQDKEVEAWIDDYKEIKNKSWSFKELRKWIANSTHDVEVKNRISSYIDIFEKHLHRD